MNEGTLLFLSLKNIKNESSGIFLKKHAAISALIGGNKESFIWFI